MLLLHILILVILLLIFLQDIQSRSVYWFLFPFLAGALFILQLQSKVLSDAWEPMVINISFLALQVFMLTIYFSIKSKKWVDVTQTLLGWGDILFLLSTAFYLSVLNYLFFYIASLLIVLSFWLIRNGGAKNKMEHIPLAGLQALIFALLLAGNWWVACFDLTNDAWLLRLITK